MKAADYRNMSETDLKEQIREQQASLAKLKFNHKVAGTENPIKMGGAIASCLYRAAGRQREMRRPAEGQTPH